MPRRVRNLLGPRPSAAFTAASGEVQQGRLRERPNHGSDEVPKQPKKLHHGLVQHQPRPLESHESDPTKRGLLKTTFQPRQCLGEDQEKKEEESPSFGSCRPLSRVADSGPKSKVNHPFISAFPSLKIYPRMSGLILEPDSRLGQRPVNASGASANVSTGTLPASGLSRGRPNKGPADDYPKPKPQEQPHPGLAEGPKQPKELHQRPWPPREWPHQMGLAEVLPRRVGNLLGLYTSADYKLCFRRSQPEFWIAFLTRDPDLSS